MSRELYGIEQGIILYGENGENGPAIIKGAAAPNGGLHDTVEVGSLYLRDNGETYKKITAGAGADKWVKMATIDDVTSINWRPELVRVLTSGVAPLEGGTFDASAFPDDDGSITGADFAVGEFVAFGAAGTEVLGKVTNIATNLLTISYVGFDALANNDMLLVRKYLPDSAGQENSAIVFYNGTDYIKISDFDWSLATGINLSGSYSASSGDPAANDTVEKAISNLDGNVDAVEDALGTSQGDTNMGTYSGDIINDDESAKQNIQQLEIALENAAKQVSSNAVTTEVSLDEVIVDNGNVVVWDVFASLDSDPTRVRKWEVSAVHNGHATADATVAKNNTTSRLKIGNFFNANIDVDLSLAGVSQVMRLRVSASAEVSFRARRRLVEA